MFKKLTGLLVGAAFMLAASGAMATYINPQGGGDGSEKSLQEILNDMTVGGQSSVNVNTDQVSPDTTWSIGGTGGALSTFVIEISSLSNINSFGLYNNGQFVEIFKGSDGAGAQALVSIKADGSVYLNFNDTNIDFTGNSFAFYLNNGTDIWFSDDALNSDGLDHMVAFQGNGTDKIQTPGNAPGYWLNNEYILAFEDLSDGADWDYNDFVVMVESIDPVPEPGTMALLGAGMLGLAIISKRRMGRK